MKHNLAAASAVLMALLGPALPLAAPKAAPADDARTADAKTHFRLGAQYYKEARYREAITEFETAYRIKPSGVLHYNIGQAYEKLGDVPSALGSYSAYLREEPQAANAATVQRAVANLEFRLGATGVQMLYVLTDPPDAEVWVDGRMRGRSPFYAALAQGPHAVSVAKAGYRNVTRDLVLSQEHSTELALSLQPGLSPSEPSPAAAALSASAATAPAAAQSASAAPAAATRPGEAPAKVERTSWLGPILAGSLAVVAAGAGVYMGVQARNAQNSLLHGYPSSPSAADSLAQKAKNDATTANVLYGVAGAAALTGGGFILFGGHF